MSHNVNEPPRYQRALKHLLQSLAARLRQNAIRLLRWSMLGAVALVFFWPIWQQFIADNSADSTGTIITGLVMLTIIVGFLSILLYWMLYGVFGHCLTELPVQLYKLGLRTLPAESACIETKHLIAGLLMLIGYLSVMNASTDTKVLSTMLSGAGQLGAGILVAHGLLWGLLAVSESNEFGDKIEALKAEVDDAVDAYDEIRREGQSTAIEGASVPSPTTPAPAQKEV